MAQAWDNFLTKLRKDRVRMNNELDEPIQAMKNIGDSYTTKLGFSIFKL